MSGIRILRRLLTIEEMKKNAPFQKEGIMSISKALTTNVDSKVNRIVEGAKRQGIDFDQYNEQQVKYILELNRPKLQPAIPAGRGITEALLGRKEGKVIKADFGKPFADEVKKDKTKGLEQTAKVLEANRKRKLNIFKNLDDNKKLNDDEYEEFLEEIGGEDRLEAYDFDGTAGSAKRILKEDVEYEQSMFDQYKKGKLDPEPKPVSSLDREVKEAYDKAVREGRLQNIRLKDGRRIESEDDFRDYIDELNEDNDFNFANGGRAGFFMGGPNPKGLGLLRKILNYMAKTGKEKGRFQELGVDLSGLDMLRLSNPKRFNKLLEDVRGKVNIKEGIMGTDSVRAQQQALREKRKGLTEKSLDVAKAIKADEDRIAKKIAEEAEITIIPQVKKQLMKDMGMSEEAAEKAARGMAEVAQKMRPLNSPPEITEEGILQLENVIKNMETGGKKARDLNADGGRIGFKDGMNRRTFLKLFTGLASIPIIGKIVKPLKLTTGVKNVPIIKTDNVAGKPEWFDQLVNKVIIEGDDVTKRFATGERQSIHQKTLDDGSVVRVTEDVDDGAIRVEYDSPDNVFEDTVQLQYKKPLPDEVNPNPAAKFDVAESGPVGRSMGPDDYEIDVDEVGGTSIRDLDSDVSKLKEYATGKKLTMKEIVEAKRRRDRAKRITEDPAEQSDAVTRRQGDADDSFYAGSNYGDVDDYASGGIARLLGE